MPGGKPNAVDNLQYCHKFKWLVKRCEYHPQMVGTTPLILASHCPIFSHAQIVGSKRLFDRPSIVMFFNVTYPLVNSQCAMENHTIFDGLNNHKWPFSTANC